MAIVIVCFVIAFIMTGFICGIINRNTFGTRQAYMGRAIVVFFICLSIIAFVFQKIGLI